MSEEQRRTGVTAPRTSVLRRPLVAMVIGTAVYVLARSLGFVLGSHVTAGGVAGGVLQALISVASVVGAYKLVIVRLGSPARDDLGSEGALRDLGGGILAGALLFSAIVGIAALLGVYRIAGEGLWSDLISPLFVTAIAPAVTEELLFRGILFRWLEESGGSLLALLLTSALFGLAHILNPGATWISSLAIAVEAGLLLGAAYMLTRSLWMPIGLHAAWNFTQGAIFGVPVSGIPSSGILIGRLSGTSLLSGGSFGLEASIIAVAVATCVGSSFLWLAANRGELVGASWRRHRVGR